MRFSLTLERNQVEPYIVTIERYMMQYPEVAHRDDLNGLYRYYIYTALTEYLCNAHSRVIGGTDLEYLLDEYLGGSALTGAYRQAAINVIGENLARAHLSIQSALTHVVNHAQGFTEEIDDMFVTFSADRNVMLLVVETAPIDFDGEDPSFRAWRQQRRIATNQPQWGNL